MAAALPLSVSPRALQLVQAAADRPDYPIGPEVAPAMLGLDEAAAGDALEQLARLGLLRRQGLTWCAPREKALADWAGLMLEMGEPGAVPAAARIDRLAALLAAPRPDPAELAGPLSVPSDMTRLLDAMRGQTVPEVLLRFPDYYEALAGLSPTQRREAVAASARSLTLPESIGAAQWQPPPSVGQPLPRLIFARAFAGGQYQRSNEQTWIAIDCSRSRRLTTPEIEQALAACAMLERQLGPGHYTRWLIIGGEVSPEALQMLQRLRIYCSNAEQVAMLNKLLAPAPARRPVEQPAVAPPLTLWRQADKAAGASIGRIGLPARHGSEFTAAQMAERIAGAAGFDQEQVGRIKTSVLEGALNAIEHSANEEKMVQLDFLLSEDALTILIENEGPPFDPLAVPEPRAADKLGAVNKRGWGINLMKRFMDELTYEPLAGGTRLRLVKRRTGPRPVTPAEIAGGRPG
jgi:serine/threonine-protein kinase RsbW